VSRNSRSERGTWAGHAKAWPSIRRALLLAMTIALVGPPHAQPDARSVRAGVEQAELVVSAAASLADVMTELAALYRDEAQVALRVNTGGSNTLARQIVEGARVDVFLSADGAQMDIVESAGRLVPGSRADLLTNALVVVAPAERSSELRTTRDLTSPEVRRVAMGNPQSVPAGVYGRRWLERVGIWPLVEPKVVPLPTVRAALSAVEEGRVDAGIVYATDARAATSARVVITAPQGEAPAIVYPVAAIRGDREQAAGRLLAWLHGDRAARVFVRAGFGIAAASRSPHR
jgi:molybdate transport system substrate-binding protein